MKCLTLLLGLGLLLVGCGGAAAPASSPAPAKPAASEAAKPAASEAAKPAGSAAAKPAASATSGSWDDIVAAARKEGKIEVLVGPGTNFRAGVQPVAGAYPGIELDAKGQHVRDARPRVLRERHRGTYS